MKRKKSQAIPLAILAIVALGVILSSLFIWNHWMKGIYQKNQIKHTLNSQMSNLKDPLNKMGFDLSKVQVSCSPGVGADQFCNARINSYTVINKSPSELNQYAKQLSDLLDKNGWYQRPDYLTKDWFKKISEQVDYQPDQLNTKKIGDTDCILDFFTSFSKPKPAAVTLSANCSKGTPNSVPTD